MNAAKTRQYYKQLTEADLCDCEYCRNYIKEIRAAYPQLAAYLDKLGVDIEKPFEAIPIGPAKGTMLYSGAQYVILGSADDFKETQIGSVRVFVTDSHPVTDIEEEHFVVELAPISLKWPEPPQLQKKGSNWTAFCDPDTGRYFAEIMYTSREGREQYDYEITKEIYEQLGTFADDIENERLIKTADMTYSFENTMYGTLGPERTVWNEEANEARIAAEAKQNK